MSISAPFIHRPVATTLLTIALALAGPSPTFFLPVSPLPQVEFPTIPSAALPGASPETMASSVATPLERQFGRIAGVNEMTSTSYLGSDQHHLQFDLTGTSTPPRATCRRPSTRRVDNCPPICPPARLPQSESRRCADPDSGADFVHVSIPPACTTPPRRFSQQKLSQVGGVGQVFVGGGALPAVRVDVNPTLLNNYGLNLEDVRACWAPRTPIVPRVNWPSSHRVWKLSTTDQLLKASDYKPLLAPIGTMARWCFPTSRRRRIRSRIFAPLGMPTASRPSWSSSSASRAPTSSTPSIACGLCCRN
jgi:multidrug efflux pump subunit AcrB